MPLSLTKENRQQYMPVIQQYIRDNQSALAQQPLCMFYQKMADDHLQSFGLAFVKGFLAVTDAGHIPRIRFPQTRMSYFVHAPLTHMESATSTQADSQKDLVRALAAFLINHRNLLIKSIINQIKPDMIREENREIFYIELFFYLRDTHFDWKDIEKIVKQHVENAKIILEKEDLKRIQRCNNEIAYINRYGVNKKRIEIIGSEPLDFVVFFETTQRAYYESNMLVADFAAILLADGFEKTPVEPNGVRLKHLWTQAVYSYLELTLSYVLTEEAAETALPLVALTSSSSTLPSSHMATISVMARQHWITLTESFINLEQIKNLYDCSQLPMGAKDEHGNDNWLINKCLLESLLVMPGFRLRLRAYNDGIVQDGDFEQLRLDLVTCFAADTPVIAAYLKTTQARGLTLLGLKGQQPALSTMLSIVTQAVAPSKIVPDAIVDKPSVNAMEGSALPNITPERTGDTSSVMGASTSSPINISPRQLMQPHYASLTSELWESTSSAPRLSSSLPSSAPVPHEDMRVYRNPLCAYSVPSVTQLISGHVGLFSSSSSSGSPPAVPCSPLSISPPQPRKISAIPPPLSPSSPPSQTAAALLSPRGPRRSGLFTRIGPRRRSSPDTSLEPAATPK